MISSRIGRYVGASLLTVGSLATSACASSGASTGDTTVLSVTLTVVGLDNNQSRLLTEMYAQALEKGGFRVGRKDPVADLAAGYVSLKNGQADLFVTYTGDLLSQAVLAEPVAAASTSTIASSSTSVTTAYTIASTDTSTIAPTDTSSAAPPTSSGQATADRITKQINAIGEIMPSSLLFGAPAEAQDKQTIYCSSIVATTNSLATFSNLAANADHLTFGETPDFARGGQFSMEGFTKAYGAAFNKTVALDAANVTSAITKGDVDCGVVRTLDYTVTKDMSVLEDDLGLATDQAVIPLLAASAATPGATQIVDQVSKALLTGDLREMMRRIAVDKLSPNIVAGDWLRAVGITTI